MSTKLDEKDYAILKLIQENCKFTAREIAKRVNSPITTVFAKIKRMEKMGIIIGYRAILNSQKLNYGTTAFVLASVSYRSKNEMAPSSQRDIAKKIARFSEVQEVHIITGGWDLLIKLKATDVESIGNFVIDKVRVVEGIEKTLTCMVFETCKELTQLSLLYE